MSLSDAPDWMTELIANQMRLMSSTPKSVADAVWWEFHKRVALEVKESLDLRVGQAKDNMMQMFGEAEFRFVEKESSCP